MPPLLRLIRPHQWTKNLLVLAAYLFTASWREPGATAAAMIAFAAFCLLSSGIYVGNDLLDVDRDRQHPVKQSRPLASGAVAVGLARALSAGLILGGIGLGATLGTGVLGVMGVYAGVQIAYIFALKHVPLLEIFVVASGFVLRAVTGAVALGVAVSGWLFVCTACLALLLVVAKRRSELVLLGPSARPVLREYSPTFLDLALVMAATSALVSYALYAVASETARAHPALVFTMPPVAYALLRYLQLALGRGEGGEPEVLLFRDPHLVAALATYVAVAVVAMILPGWPSDLVR